MTLRAIGIHPGPYPKFNRGGGIGDRGRMQIVRDIRLVDGRVKHLEVVKGAKLVVNSPGGRISEVSVELMCLETQDVACRRVVTEEAIGAAWISPGMNNRFTSRTDNRYVFIKAIREQIGITVIVPPLVGHAVDRAVLVAHQEARLQSLSLLCQFVDDKIKFLYEDSAVGKGPFTGRDETDLFVGSVRRPIIGQGDPAALQSAIRPER